MGRGLWFVCWALLLVAFEFALSPHLALGGVSPDWLLILTVFVVLRAPAAEAYAAAWLLGLLADLLVGTRLGLFALGYLLVAAVLLRIRLTSRRSAVAFGVAVFLAALVVHALLAVDAAAEGLRGAGRCVWNVAAISLYTGLVGIPLGRLLEWTAELRSRGSRLEVLGGS